MDTHEKDENNVCKVVFFCPLLIYVSVNTLRVYSQHASHQCSFSSFSWGINWVFTAEHRGDSPCTEG